MICGSTETATTSPRRTPMLTSRQLSELTGYDVRTKAEMFQRRVLVPRLHGADARTGRIKLGYRTAESGMTLGVVVDHHGAVDDLLPAVGIDVGDRQVVIALPRKR